MALKPQIEMKKPKRKFRAQVMLTDEEQKSYWDLAIVQGVDFSELVRRLLREELIRHKKEQAA